jgi:murein DD-endopeptidase MepM/ murein hydrolase activator NlpD
MKVGTGGRSVTVLLQRDGATRSRTLRIPIWTLRVGVALVGLAVLGLLLVAVLYVPLVRAAARVPGLEREVARLRGENAKVRELSAALDSLERRYVQVRQMIGADIVRDPLATTATLPVAPPIRARAAPSAAENPATGVPSRWPLDEVGYVTRGQIGAATGTGTTDEAHPGIDIAVPSGSLIRASGGGTVRQTGEDPEYGTFVLLEHADGYQTMYGHLSRVVVTTGRSVVTGEVIGLSGSTGRSTAPHLHFEVRRQGLSIDPLTMVHEGR